MGKGKDKPHLALVAHHGNDAGLSPLWASTRGTPTFRKFTVASH